MHAIIRSPRVWKNIKTWLGPASSTCVCPFALCHDYLTWPITWCNSNGLNDPTLPRLPPRPLVLSEAEPRMNLQQSKTRLLEKRPPCFRRRGRSVSTVRISSRGQNGGEPGRKHSAQDSSAQRSAGQSVQCAQCTVCTVCSNSTVTVYRVQ